MVYVETAGIAVLHDQGSVGYNADMLLVLSRRCHHSLAHNGQEDSCRNNDTAEEYLVFDGYV